jgi:2-hydroxyglutarate dehydrogenase
MVRTNIYPVPDPRFPFLGVHFTPRMDGTIWLGPNAVLAFRREGYNRSDFALRDAAEAVAFPGLRKFAFKYLGHGLREMYRSINTRAQVELLKRFIPSLTVADVVRGPTGVRAQAMDDEGRLVEDFVFDGGTGPLAGHVLHVRNAPSPAATSSLAIAKVIADRVEHNFLHNTS